MELKWRDYRLDFASKTCIMGILNVTPDSFSDGGIYFDKARAVERAFRMAEEGADIIDIGGQSTRPGSEPVPVEEELKRTIPVIEALKGRLGIPVSIDTYRAEVAKRAVEAGADMINDISGLMFDPEMAHAVAKAGVPVVIMHIKGTPKDMQANPVYEALIPEVMDYLREGIRLAVSAGVKEDMIVVDPGIGFGKTFEHNLEILNRLGDFTLLGKPILVGVSRKAFIGKILGDAPPSERLEGTLAAVSIAVLNGANIVRVHDVREVSKAVKVADAVINGGVS